MKKVLAVLVNYGEDQLQYLEKVVDQLKSFKKYEVTVVVNTNIPLDIEGVDIVNVINLDNYQFLPLTCKSVIYSNKDDFDIFLFGENDHLFKEHHIDKHLEYESFLPEDRITGLIQFEQYKKGKFYCAFHDTYDWDLNSVEIYNEKVFATPQNLHQATFILTQQQLYKICKIHDFTQFFGNSHYSVKCKVNTDIYQFCGMKKLICISELKFNQIQHLPSIVYERHKKRFSNQTKVMGKWEEWMNDKITSLIDNASK